MDVVNQFDGSVVYEMIRDNTLSPHVMEHIMALREYEQWGASVIRSGEIPEGVDKVLNSLPTKIKMMAFLFALRDLTATLATQDFQANILRETAPEKLEASINDTQLLHQHGLANEYLDGVASGEIDSSTDIMDFILNHEPKIE